MLQPQRGAAAVADYSWPGAGDRKLIGTDVSRIEDPLKVSGKAQYTTDFNLPGMLFATTVQCPYPHAKILSIDTTAAQTTPGFKAVYVIQKAGTEILWAGDDVVAVAAVDEFSAAQAAKAVIVKYQQLPHLVVDSNPDPPAGYAQPMKPVTLGDADAAFLQADAVVEQTYTMPVITHCCLEPHGSVVTWSADYLDVYISTQSVSGIVTQMSKALDLPASKIRVHAQFEGGGFGSKLAADRWGLAAAQLSKLAGGLPVRLVVDRRTEQQTAGCRPSAYGTIKIGSDAQGNLTAWQATTWSTGGMTGGAEFPVPYILKIPNQNNQHTTILNNIGSARSMRAPRQPQACFLTMCAIEDLADKLGMNPLALVLKNLKLAGPQADVYKEEFAVAEGLMDWNKRWHPRNKGDQGPIRQGLGLAFHTWSGTAHPTSCNLTINPDGSVVISAGTQDIGTGTRTVIAIVAAETFGLDVAAIQVEIGESAYPPSAGSGGSGTVGGMGSAVRRASVDALHALFAKIAGGLGVQPGVLQASGGQVTGGKNAVTWRQACSMMGGLPITVQGVNPGQGDLNSAGVGGVQMADVSVDVETGVVSINKLVAVQDCGLIINPKTLLSQCYGCMIMGIGYALYEEKIMDPNLGCMLNPNMEFYRLCGIGDIGQLVVHLMSGEGYDARGIVGCGEPPVISPGAAIANAVANAIGVRVPSLPLTPDRVLAALGAQQ
jgi:xanthine dehydrogenase YagR molybdenum-binding subunit